jgi:hypothetical protein
MRDDHLKILKDYVECSLSADEWQSWLAAHAAEIDADSGRLVRLRLQHRGFGAVQGVLQEQGVEFQIPEGRCRGCGAPIFEAVPGVTTPDEIRAFAGSSQLRGREQIARDGWIHPGRHCPNGCTMVLQEFRRV